MGVACARSKTVFANFAALSTLLALSRAAALVPSVFPADWVRGDRTADQLYASMVSPLSAASIAATSIFFMGIIASKARLAAAVSGLVVASSRTRGGICQEKPHRSLHQPQALSSPPLSTIAFQ